MFCCRRKHIPSRVEEPEPDMAVMLTFFNPCNSKRILMNFLYIFSKLKSEGVPIYAIELTFDGQTPSIHFENVIHVHSNSIFFHKERLYRILEKSVPSKYTKLLFMDSDIYYDQPDWYSIVSKALDVDECIQPFRTIKYLDLSYTQVYGTMESCLLNPHKAHDSKYMVGMAWAMKRSYYNSSGFYDYCIVGNGDCISAMHFTGKTFDDIRDIVLRLHTNNHKKYLETAVPKSISYCNLTLNHLYHGTLKNRQYWDRNFIFKTLNGDIQDFIIENVDGVFEWKTQKLLDTWNPAMLEYFKNRCDDDIGIEGLSFQLSVTQMNKTDSLLFYKSID
jgi:hypothetical protein